MIVKTIVPEITGERTIQRHASLPSVFCAFAWVRTGHGIFNGFADRHQEPEDWRLRSLYKDIIAGEKDVSELDDEGGLKLAIDVPATSYLGHPTFYYWKLKDVCYLLDDARPAEGVPIRQAGFCEETLLALDKCDPYLPYIRDYEKCMGRPKGYYFPVEREQNLNDFEGKLFAKFNLRQRIAGLKKPKHAARKPSSGPQVSSSMRNDVLQFHQYECFFDGRKRPKVILQVHHIFTRKMIECLGLSPRLFTARENLVASCSDCNVAKSAKLSNIDVNFCLSQFSFKTHPNHALIPHLQKLRDLQQRE